MALLSLFTMALPMGKGTNLPKASSTMLWIFMGAGAISAIAAPVSYLYLPTEWSSLVNIVAGAIQAFATLQIALAAGEITRSSFEERIKHVFGAPYVMISTVFSQLILVLSPTIFSTSISDLI